MPIIDKNRLEGGVTESRDFADFVHQRSTPMLRTAWLLTGGDWALAEDLAQTAFSEVWRHWTRVSVMDAPEAYAHKVMLNTFLSWRRRRRWTAEISTERFVVSPATTGGFAKDPLNIQAFSSGDTADCAGFAFSGTTFATYNGVTWAIQADHSGAVACAGARMTKKNTGSVGMGFEQDTVAYLPTPLGPSGVKVMLPLFKFLGTNPANWTTNPFVN